MNRLLRKEEQSKEIKLYDIVVVEYPGTNYKHIGKVTSIRLYDGDRSKGIPKYFGYRVEGFDLEIFSEKHIRKVRSFINKEFE